MMLSMMPMMDVIEEYLRVMSAYMYSEWGVRKNVCKCVCRVGE